MLTSEVFETLTTQKQIREILQGAIKASISGENSNQMTHAWVFIGPPGSGRSSAALAFAQALICPKNGCGSCAACNLVMTNSHPDVEIIRTENFLIKVEEVRELLTRAAWAPTMGGWRVFVLEDADRLTESAANALLKAIEEPGTRTVWLLCTPTLHDVLPTISSRCRHIQLRTPSNESVTDVLINRYHIAPGVAYFAARASQGHIGRAKYLATNETARNNRRIIMQLPLQLASFSTVIQGAQTLVDLANTQFNSFLNERDEKEIKKLKEAYGKDAIGGGMGKGGAKAIKELEKAQKSRSTRMFREALENALLDIVTFYRDVMMVQSGNVDSIINTDMREQIERYATSEAPHSTVRKINAIFEAREKLARNVAPLVTCEVLMCQLANM